MSFIGNLIEQTLNEPYNSITNEKPLINPLINNPFMGFDDKPKTVQTDNTESVNIDKRETINYLASDGNTYTIYKYITSNVFLNILHRRDGQLIDMTKSINNKTKEINLLQSKHTKLIDKLDTKLNDVKQELNDVKQELKDIKKSRIPIKFRRIYKKKEGINYKKCRITRSSIKK